MIQVWSGFGDALLAQRLLVVWRRQGPGAARALLAQMPPHGRMGAGPLVEELALRLEGAPGPRLLVDGVWLSRPHGGITRVWEQVLRCWSLPEMLSPNAPVRILERDSYLALVERFDAIAAASVDPLDWDAVAASAQENAEHARTWAADVFLSSWISSCGGEGGAWPELALVHDCIPERANRQPPRLRALRQRWMAGARGLLAVSAATAADVERFCSRTPGSVAWCHLAPDPLFSQTLSAHVSERLWRQLQAKAALQPPFVLLPSTSSIGSYKNPELVAQALLTPGLERVQLVLSGLAASTHAKALEIRWPALASRLLVVGFTDHQLAFAYRRALAVVLPSRVEGFGLPAVEALAAGATVLVADAPGLREAGGSACPRFNPEQPNALAAWLRLLLHAPSAAWLEPRLQARRHRHLQHRNPDLFGLALLAQARSLSCAGHHSQTPALPDAN